MGEIEGVPPSQDRRRRTLWLLAAGGASLLLPLLGLAYVHWSEARPSGSVDAAADVFERHEGHAPVVPSQAMPNAAALAPTAAGLLKPVSSLDYVKPDPEFTERAGNGRGPGAAGPATSTETTAAAAAKKRGKKPFVMPKLQPGAGFIGFGSNAPGAGNVPASKSGGQSPQQLLQNLPAEAQNNPDLQKYLQSPQGH